VAILNDALIALRLALQLERVPRMPLFDFKPNPKRPFLDTLFLSLVVIAFMAVCGVVLYFATSGLWLLVHKLLVASHA
jgi:hypothetical protein